MRPPEKNYKPTTMDTMYELMNNLIFPPSRSWKGFVTQPAGMPEAVSLFQSKREDSWQSQGNIWFGKIINALLKRIFFQKQASLKSGIFSPKLNKVSAIKKYFKSFKNKKSWKVFTFSMF